MFKVSWLVIDVDTETSQENLKFQHRSQKVNYSYITLTSQ